MAQNSTYDRLIRALMGQPARSPVPSQWATDAAYPPPWSQVSGLVEPGNINVFNRPLVHNPDGSTSTVHTMSYGNRAGQEVAVPTVSNEGAMMNPHDAMRYWGQRGQFLGKFATPEDADAYAQALHEQQAAFYGLK